MAATFDPSLAAPRDHIRLALGDKHDNATSGAVTAPLLQDEVIDAKLAAFSYAEALAQLAEALVTQFAQDPDKYAESGGLKLEWTERIRAWTELASRARAGLIVAPSTRRTSRGTGAVGVMAAPSLCGLRTD